ncbi:glycosyltransferase family 4 protein [Thermus sp. SYSU G05001]|uniref:Glycosyltransferase family 4 protein n=1 Tax=Thermus brevis TaxID=2862456 RepID=A0ABS6ZXL0_9DEIN|nr:glycosyltransferase family 4 protein [Thermus brevis]MBW6394560.1 glycosyltransferase family 4 protein [Thermus brevis]
MRVLYITSSLPFGVGEPFLYPEIRAIKDLGVDLKVVPLYPRGTLVHPEAKAVITMVEAAPLFSWRILQVALRVLLRFPKRALQALLLLLTPNPWHLLKNLTVFPKALWLADLAMSWRADHIHAHWAATTSSMAMAASHVSGVPWSLTAHRWDVVENNLLHRKARHARFFRCISEKTKSMALERGVPEEKVLVLHLGVSLPALSELTSRRDRASRETFVLLCPAAFLPVKGHRFLIEALAELPDRVQLWLAGDGPLRPELESQVQRLGLKERVRFLGYLAHDQLLELYRDNQVDAVVLPSVDLGDGLNEGIPVALMEAMAFGCPVIATATGGIPELLRDGAGLLVPDKSSQALATAILRFLNDDTLRKETAERGRLRVRTQFSVEDIAQTLIKLWGSGDA